MAALYKWMALVLFIAILEIQESDASVGEERLQEFLFDGYSKLALPVKGALDKLYINFSLAISQIVDVDERNQVLTSKVWVKQVWNDYNLKWNPDEFDGIERIKVPSDAIWIPDILIYNNANGSFDMQTGAWASVDSNGNVNWSPPAVYKSSCKIDAQYFPFDEQNCTMKFGSWTYDFGKIDLIPSSPSAEKKDYWENGEWAIIQSPCERHVISYLCCAEVYVDVTCTFLLRRMPLYYFAYLLLPCGLISFNTVLVFYLPPDISEKMSLCTSVLLSMAWFLLLVTQRIPPTGNNFPLIVKYLLFTMVVVSSSIILTVFVLNIRYRSPHTHKMPKWVRTIFINILPKYIALKRPERYDQRCRNVGVALTREAVTTKYVDAKKLVMESKGNSYTVRLRNEVDRENGLETDSDGDVITSERNGDACGAGAGAGSRHPSFSLTPTYWAAAASSATGKADTPSSSNGLRRTSPAGQEERQSSSRFLPSTNHDPDPCEAMNVHRAVEEIMYMTSRYRNEDDLVRAREDWKYVAMVVDRIFLIIFLCGVFAGTITIMLEAPLAKEFFAQAFI
ncbi:neuronal acetylcholine receptor subunit alpha-3-like isoform X1 [Asterias amurensis]|uniref:neuronal acetylcholine receptor subunit alpha-3-like isoform X1 n=1 Tax=Asterias amurensis TaxID=7602 RepID=UPI003AB1140A